MSSIMIIQDYSSFTFAVDTAKCWGDNDNVRYRAYGEKVQKVHQYGKDMVFLAGMTECTEAVEEVLHEFIKPDNHVNIEQLKQYLRMEYPKEKSRYADTGLNDIGVIILTIHDGRSVLFSLGQSNFYDIFMSAATRDETKLFVDGFDQKRIHDYALEYLKTLKASELKKANNFIHVYQNNYSEGVGGTIRVYELNSAGCRMIKEHDLEEKNLRYVVTGEMLQKLGGKLPRKLYTAHVSASSIMGSSLSGNTITGGSISGATFTQTGPDGTVQIVNGGIIADLIFAQGINIGPAISLSSGLVQCNHVTASSGNITSLSTVSSLNGGTPITSLNIGSQTVNKANSADYASNAGSASLASSLINPSTLRGAYITTYDNLVGSPNSTIMNVGSSSNPWAGGYGVSGWTVTSDERLKKNIDPLKEDDRWLRFIKKVIPCMFQMIQGTSGRYHTGFIAQQVEQAMIECGISDMDFAGLVKAPVYAKMLKNEKGEDTQEYDTSSEIIDYTYHLRYEEFIPLLLTWIIELEERLCTIENRKD